MSGWPGATHSVDICEDLEDWSGANLSNMSDTEEEDTVRLVSLATELTFISPAITTKTDTLDVFTLRNTHLILFSDLLNTYFRSQSASPHENTRLQQAHTDTVQMTSSLNVMMSYSCSKRRIAMTGALCLLLFKFLFFFLLQI